MPKTQEESPVELLRWALSGFDAYIAELQERRAQLAALAESESPAAEMATASSGRPRKMSEAARAKISAAAKARWANLRKARAKKQTPQPTAKKAKSKGGKQSARPQRRTRRDPRQRQRRKQSRPAAAEAALPHQVLCLSPIRRIMQMSELTTSEHAPLSRKACIIEMPKARRIESAKKETNCETSELHT